MVGFQGALRFYPGQVVGTRRVIAHLDGAQNHRWIVQCVGCGQLGRVVTSHLANGTGRASGRCPECRVAKRPEVLPKWPTVEEVEAYLGTRARVYGDVDWDAVRSGPVDRSQVQAWRARRAKQLPLHQARSGRPRRSLKQVNAHTCKRLGAAAKSIRKFDPEAAAEIERVRAWLQERRTSKPR